MWYSILNIYLKKSETAIYLKFKKYRYKYSIYILLSCVFVFQQQLYAQEQTQILDKQRTPFYLSIGGYLITQADTTIALTNKNIGAGVSINPDDVFDLDMEKTVIRVSSSYRFNPKNRLSFSWYRIASSGNKKIEQDIDWIDLEGNDIIIKAGASMDTDFSYDIYKLAYDWSFYHNDKVEIYTSIGLNLAQLDFDLDTQASTNETIKDKHKDIDTQLPLPVLGFGLNYQVSRYFHWYINSQILMLGIDNIKGSYSNTQIGGEIKMSKHTGIGLALVYDTLDVVQDDNDQKLTFSNRINGFNLYFSTFF